MSISKIFILIKGVGEVFFSPKIFNAEPVWTPLAEKTQIFAHHKMHPDA